jgi:hypothetical protein
MHLTIDNLFTAVLVVVFGLVAPAMTIAVIGGLF